jgi:hypothetical protein
MALDFSCQVQPRGLLENTFKEYKRLGVIVRDARNGGLIDWDAVEDRTREVNTHPSWDSPADIISSAASSYREALWEGQCYRPEVWIEKNVLIGVPRGRRSCRPRLLHRAINLLGVEVAGAYAPNRAGARVTITEIKA